MKSTNLVITLDLLIKELKIPITHQSIVKEISKHPNPDTLLAMSELLSNWHVPNAAYQFTYDDLILAKIKKPFIAYCSNNEFSLIYQLDSEWAVMSDSSGNKSQLSAEEFKQKYAGYILVASKAFNSGEEDYTSKNRKEINDRYRIPTIVTCLVILLFGSLYIRNMHVYLSSALCVLLFIKAVGVILTILMLVQVFDSQNPFIQKICGTKKQRCNTILSSKASKIGGVLSWAEVGFFYFSGTLFALIFESAYPGAISLLGILCVTSLPYTFYSIYYQWRVAKEWCKLCCGVQLLLWLEFFAFFPFISEITGSYQNKVLIAVIIDMLFPILIWAFIKPFLLKANQITALTQSYNKIKYNADLFTRLINSEIKYQLPEDRDSLIFGNKDASMVLTMVSNPNCGPCGEAHKTIEAWLETRNDIKLQVIFITPNRTKDISTNMVSRLMSLKHGNNMSHLRFALLSWYEKQYSSLEEWEAQFPITIDPNADEILSKQRDWCKMTNIKSTPTLFVNGQRLPNTYMIEDIKYFL